MCRVLWTIKGKEDIIICLKKMESSSLFLFNEPGTGDVEKYYCYWYAIRNQSNFLPEAIFYIDPF
jgi:hypothetical protein